MAVPRVAAQRIFDKEQFLFLKFEDLMAMKAPGLLRLLSNFTGLHTDETIIRKVLTLTLTLTLALTLTLTLTLTLGAQGARVRGGLGQEDPALLRQVQRQQERGCQGAARGAAARAARLLPAVQPDARGARAPAVCVGYEQSPRAPLKVAAASLLRLY